MDVYFGTKLGEAGSDYCKRKLVNPASLKTITGEILALVTQSLVKRVERSKANRKLTCRVPNRSEAML